MASMFSSFKDRAKHTLQEAIIIKMADWSIKNDRPDLALTIYTIGELSGVIDSKSFKLPTKHKKAILAEFPNAFDPSFQLEFELLLVEAEGDE